MPLVKRQKSIVAIMAGWLLLPRALRLRIIRRDLIGSDPKFRFVGRHANTRRIDF
jgi:hypothetical protein